MGIVENGISESENCKRRLVSKTPTPTKTTPSKTTPSKHMNSNAEQKENHEIAALWTPKTNCYAI